MRPDYLIVGSGLTGATIARVLHDAGHRVLVIERRDRVGGNVADRMHPCGIRMGLHGPHYFRTSCDELWRFVNRFTSFIPFEAVVKSRVGGRLENWPVAGSTIRRLAGASWSPEFVGRPTNFEEAALSLMPRIIYEAFVKGYTEKQWGVPARTLSADLCRRFDVRHDDDPRLTPTRKYQGVPTDGYTRFVERMLEGIPIELGVDYLSDRDRVRPRGSVVFTGPIDAYFHHCYGRLTYRGQRRRTWFVRGVSFLQPCAQVNEPDPSEPIIRTIEWKHLMPVSAARSIDGTLLTTEQPFFAEDPDDLEYPFPDEANSELYRRYRALASEERDVLICGRLGEYRYYDMDQAIGRAMVLARQLMERNTWDSSMPSTAVIAAR